MTPEFDNQLLKGLTSSEMKVLHFIRLHEKVFLSMSIQELAKSTYTSAPSIIRLCKKLQLEGFNELKYMIRSKTRMTSPDADPALDLKGVISGNLNRLKETVQEISPADLTFASDCLASTKNIYLFGRGLTYMPLTYMHQILLSVDRDCLCFIDPPLMFNSSAHMTENDVVFIASSGGSTDGIYRSAALAKENGASVIALTSDKDSPLAGYSDVVFYCSSPKRYLNGIDVKSRFTIMFVIDLILTCYLNRMQLNPPSDPRTYLEQRNW